MARAFWQEGTSGVELSSPPAVPAGHGMAKELDCVFVCPDRRAGTSVRCVVRDASLDTMGRKTICWVSCELEDGCVQRTEASHLSAPPHVVMQAWLGAHLQCLHARTGTAEPNSYSPNPD